MAAPGHECDQVLKGQNRKTQSAPGAVLHVDSVFRWVVRDLMLFQIGKDDRTRPCIHSGFDNRWNIKNDRTDTNQQFSILFCYDVPTNKTEMEDDIYASNKSYGAC